MNKDFIKIMTLLSVVLCLTGCARKTTEVSDDSSVNCDLAVNVNGNYRIFDKGEIHSGFKKACTNGLKYEVYPGEAAIYEKSEEIEATINQINLMEHGDGDGFQRRIFFIGENGLEDYPITWTTSNGWGIAEYWLSSSKSSICVPFWQYLIYTCPVGSKSALELAREQMGLNLK